MNIDITTAAILFPTISLFMLAYTNRFSSLVSRIRELSERCEGSCDQAILKQVRFLERRVKLIITMQGFLVFSLLLSVLSILLLTFNFYEIAKITFLISLFSILVSLILSFFEIKVSGNALEIQLDNIKKSS